ncbi:MAG TPA: endonuclease/exonuclease/phosphatase family protein [Candidatus Paceibacterota bacterium]|nr:endonuclease/exonuclease/phosphatase family protein [Candidatus Paceibacterota bacterium]
MKLVSLNAWGGTQFNQLLSFVEKHANSTDVFCFQEVAVSERIQSKEEKPRHNLLRDLSEVLPGFQVIYAPFQEGFNWEPIEKDIALCNAMFVRNGLNILEHGHVFVHGEKNGLDFAQAAEGNWYTMPRLVQFTQIDGFPTIFNFHGFWHKDGKHDTPERIKQSEKIVEVVQKFNNPRILCGDFNLNIDTESLAMLEDRGGLRNLIKDHKIGTTRSDLYPKKSIMPYADYMFVSPDITINSFSVPDEPASDHLPMILEFK